MERPTLGSWSHALALTGAQWALAASAVLALLWSAGGFSIFLPTVSILAAAAVLPKLLPGPWTRPDIQQLSRRVAVAHGALAPAAVAGIALLHPDWLTGAHPLGAALAAGLLAAAGSFVLTLCGLNATAERWGSFEGPYGDRLHPAFRRPEDR